jgi:hypothetical protein
MFVTCYIITDSYVTILIQLKNKTKIKQLPKHLRNGGQAALPTVSCVLWSTLPSQALQVSLFILLLWYKHFHSSYMPRHLWNLYNETAKLNLFFLTSFQRLSTLQIINLDLRQQLSSLAF